MHVLIETYLSTDLPYYQQRDTVMSNSNTNEIDIGLIAHDLRGPLTNIEGFYSELELSINQLLTTLKEHRDQLPEDLNEKIDAIFRDDVDPCLKYSNSMIKKMSNCLDNLEK